MELGYKVKLKKLKLDIDIQKKYNQDYELDNMIRDNVPWKYGECMVLDNEELLFSLFYRNNGSIAEENDGAEWYGLNRFIFHIVKSKDGIYIKYLNLRGIEDIVRKYARSAIENLGFYQEQEFGLIQREYKNYIRKEAMKIVKIEENEFRQEIEKVKNIKYDDLEFFSCAFSEESIDCCDYINKNYFYCDDYYLEKYSQFIELINYILKKSNILNMKNVNLKSFRKEEKLELMKKLIIKKIEFEGGIIE